MATTQTLVADVILPGLRAVTDLTGYQYKFVQVNARGVDIADARSTAYCGTYVLGAKVSSGTDAPLCGPPNVARVMAGNAITVGAWVYPMSATGLAAVTSAGNTDAVGVAFTATTNGSGDYLSVHLRR